MKPLSRRRLLASLVVLGAGATGLRFGGAHAAAPRVIDVTAQRFRFTPAQIALKAGEPVVLAVRSLDFPHGFNIPDLNVRRDLIPGRITRIDVRIAKPGIVDFLCDNFCGEGHELMHGRLVVTG